MNRKQDEKADAFGQVVLEIFRLNGHLLEAGDELTRPVGLTGSRWQVLGAVADGPASVAQVGRVMGLARQSVQRTADLLAQDGLIEYAENPHHRRAKLMKITPEAKRSLDYVGQRQAEWADRISCDESLEDLRTTAKVLARLEEKLSQDASESSDGSPQHEGRQEAS